MIDPAVYAGDGWTDIAMLGLFGRVPESFIQAYADLRGEPVPDESRFLVYNLYHLLNHVLLFGGTYTSAVSETLGQITF